MSEEQNDKILIILLIVLLVIVLFSGCKFSDAIVTYALIGGFLVGVFKGNKSKY